MHEPRFILHIDLDAFYASIEQRDRPELRGKPVIVGGSPDRRGVVSTASYEARRFGVHSAMPSRTAQRLCPQAIFLPARFEVYRAVSGQVMAIFQAHTALVEPLSLDEAYLDVTTAVRDLEEAAQLAREIKQQIRSTTDLTASAGVSYCKFLAKLASDAHKPDGLTVISPEQAPVFLEALSIEKFFGVGKVTATKLRMEPISNAWARSACMLYLASTGASSIALCAARTTDRSNPGENASRSARKSPSSVTWWTATAWKASWRTSPGRWNAVWSN